MWSPIIHQGKHFLKPNGITTSASSFSFSQIPPNIFLIWLSKASDFQRIFLNPPLESHLKVSLACRIYSHATTSRINWQMPHAFWWPPIHCASAWQRPIQPSSPSSEVNCVNPGAKCVSKVQRFMPSFKIQPIPVHKKKKINCWTCFVLVKINHGSCQGSHYPLNAGVLHCMLTSSVLNCISIRLWSCSRLKLLFVFPSPPSILRSLLVFPKITVSVWTN